MMQDSVANGVQWHCCQAWHRHPFSLPVGNLSGHLPTCDALHCDAGHNDPIRKVEVTEAKSATLLLQQHMIVITIDGYIVKHT
jgi:hypothetical protein